MREVNPRCLCIVLTGHPDEESQLKGTQLGIDDYIQKPAKADTLVALLADKLAAREAQHFKVKLRSALYDSSRIKAFFLRLKPECADLEITWLLLRAWPEHFRRLATLTPPDTRAVCRPHPRPAAAFCLSPDETELVRR